MKVVHNILAGSITVFAFLLSISALARYFIFDPVAGNAILIEQGLELYDMHYKPWTYALYLHIITAAVAISIGPFQFIKKIRNRNVALHRQLGKVYVSSTMVSGIIGIYLSIYAFGGFISKAGFLTLSVSWIYTTYKAYKHIRKRNIMLHREWMYRSYAITLVAITFRIWSALIGYSFDDFKLGYVVAIWLALIGNIIVGEIWIRKVQRYNKGLEFY